jgi:sRNA-binding regulator protein Hfq
MDVTCTRWILVPLDEERNVMVRCEHISYIRDNSRGSTIFLMNGDTLDIKVSAVDIFTAINS